MFSTWSNQMSRFHCLFQCHIMWTMSCYWTGKWQGSPASVLLPLFLSLFPSCHLSNSPSLSFPLPSLRPSPISLCVFYWDFEMRRRGLSQIYPKIGHLHQTMRSAALAKWPLLLFHTLSVYHLFRRLKVLRGPVKKGYISYCLPHLRRLKMGGWENVKMWTWEEGMMGEWEDGRMGILEYGWEEGMMGGWGYWKMGGWEDGRMGLFEDGKMGGWEDGRMGRMGGWEEGIVEVVCSEVVRLNNCFS